MTTTPDAAPGAAPQDVPPARRRWRRRSKVLAGVLGAMLVGTAAFAASNWLVGLNGGSSGQARSGSISNLTITASASPGPGNLLYPGGTGDVVLTISNPNAFPVQITAVNLPTSTTYAAGYTDPALTNAQAGCSSSTSLVAWNYATGTTGSSHTLTTSLTVAASGQANNPLTVTLTNDAVMGAAAPAACASTYFSLPSLTGVTASAATSGSPTTSPATSSWTS